jgi:DNA-binding transcriptional LysR family regulator
MKLESLEELPVFTQIVECGSMASAGKVLAMPANTVSRRLASLEARLNTKLLNRTTRSVSVSEHGRTLLSQALRILEAAELAETMLQQESEGLAGLVRIGLPSILTADILTSLRPLLIGHPGLRLEVSVHDQPVNPVSAGLDVVIMGGTLPDSTLIARKLHDVQLIFAASETYLEEFGEPQTPQDLAGHRTLHFKTNPPQSTWVLHDKQGGQHVVPVQGHFEANDGRALMDAMRAGLGIASTSRRIVRNYPELRRVMPEYTGLTFPVYAIYPTSGQRSARLQAVVTTLQEAVV